MNWLWAAGLSPAARFGRLLRAEVDHARRLCSLSTPAQHLRPQLGGSTGPAGAGRGAGSGREGVGSGKSAIVRFKAARRGRSAPSPALAWATG